MADRMPWLEGVLNSVRAERERQEVLKAGRRDSYSDDERMFAVMRMLVEEVGEVTRILLVEQRLTNDRNDKELRKKLSQMAALAGAWIEALDEIVNG